MKNLFVYLFIFTIVFHCCTNTPTDPKKSTASLTRCTTWDCIEKNKNKAAEVEGLFRKFTPWEDGKGAGAMYWNWEVVLSDSLAVPVGDDNTDIDYASFEGKRVVVSGKIFHGTVIGGTESYAQSAIGYRLDPVEILEK